MHLCRKNVSHIKTKNIWKIIGLSSEDHMLHRALFVDSLKKIHDRRNWELFPQNRLCLLCF